MKKWARCSLLAALVAGLVAAGLYEGATHVGRGWLRGEAFYQGRPTSYWRERCDEWIARFPGPEVAAGYTPIGIDGHPPFHEGGAGDILVLPAPLPRTVWRRISESIRPTKTRLGDIELDGRDYWPPAVLLGRPGSEPVLEELAKEERFVIHVERSLRYAKAYRDSGRTE